MRARLVYIAIALGLLGAASFAIYRVRTSRPSRDAAPVVLEPVQLARPLCGTGASHGTQTGDNNTFPGAVAPFGMIQWSPDTEKGRKPGGYAAWDKRISGFSVDHISGAGCRYGGDFSFMPLLGEAPTTPPENRTSFAAPFSHKNEVAKPGYYAVTLDDGAKVELTTTVRTGFGRFTFPAGASAGLMLNAASDVSGASASSITIDPATHEVTGWSNGGHFCTPRDSRKSNARKIYFYAAFDQPFLSFSTWSDASLTEGATSGTGARSGIFLRFDASRNRTLLAKIGLSYVSVANAKANVAAESPVAAFSSDDFDKAVKSASSVWAARLQSVEVKGGTEGDERTFYSMVYHTMMGPSIVSDSNGEYTGYDNTVHTVAPGHAQYGVFSGWDIYRSQCQWLALIAPKEASDMAESLLEDYRQGGAFPRWGLITEDGGAMVGDPAAQMIADFYAFGATDFEAREALAGLVRAATDPSVTAPRTRTNERDALADYLHLGYVPEHQEGQYGNVSMTLEYASADFAIAQLARAVGGNDDYARLMGQAQNWRNLFNPDTGYLQMRRRDGSWAPGFTETDELYDGDHAYAEGNAAQYVWMVPFNLKTLVDMMGGTEATAKRLDAFFVKLNGGSQGPNAKMAWMGNEPSLHVPWVYCFLGAPYKTQGLVRRITNELYSPQDAAYPGNDDVGELSSWYVFAALGMYPEIPGSDVLVLNGPRFPKAVLHLKAGDLVIAGSGARSAAPYIQSLTVNGAASTKPWIRMAELLHGGKLDYVMGPKANAKWGADPNDAPPSFTEGMPAAATR